MESQPFGIRGIESRDAFISWSPSSNRVLYTCGSTVFVHPGDTAIPMKNGISSVEYCSWSLDGEHVLLGDKDRAVEVSLNRSSVKTIANAKVAWWNPRGIAYVRQEEDDRQTLVDNGQEYPISPRYYVTAATSDGSMILARVRQAGAHGKVANAVAIARNSGGGGLAFRTVHSIPLGLRLNSGGDFIVANKVRKEALIGLGCRSDGYKYSSIPYSCDLRRMTLHEVWEDQFSFSAPQPSVVRDGFIGLRRKVLSRPNNPTNSRYSYTFRLLRKYSDYLPVDGDLLATGCTYDGSDSASVLFLDGHYVFVRLRDASVRVIRLVKP